ncbi:hypothetical protein ND16A_2633 [Thalassotalea sp. ND16A]|nr:hypothetical protein ND16A_2633 [Thalassotalea sp. ND16A]
MKKMSIYLALSLASALSCQALAEQPEQAAAEPLKQWNVGIGSYATTINVDGNHGDEDLDFSGLNLAGTYAFNDNVAIRAGYYSLDFDDDSELESSGLDLLAYYGTGFATEGFKAYIGGGFFTDTWEAEGEDEDFSGIQLNGGIGYNWEFVSLELMLGIRSADDYADFIEDLGGNGDVTAISSSLLLSARF